MKRLPIAALLFVAGCQDSTGSIGYYVLTAVDTVPVPRLVSATTACDEFVLRGVLHLTRGGSFDLSVTQSQDCTRVGGAADTFSTITSGAFSQTSDRIFLHPAGTGLELEGTFAGATVELLLPQLPLLDGSHSGSFVIAPL